MVLGWKLKFVGLVLLLLILVFDNGVDIIKVGFVIVDDDMGDKVFCVIFNCIVCDCYNKIYVGVELEKCKDFGEIIFWRLVEKGFIVNWEV